MGANNIAILSFSGRKNGNCELIAKHVQSLTGGKIYSFADLDVHPCGRCHYECFQRGADCPHIGDNLKTIYEAVLQSDRTYYVLPNYCDYPNANFFAFNERSLCIFSGCDDLLNAYFAVPKKFIVISSGEQENFRAVLSQHAADPEILFLAAKNYGQKSIAGDLMTSPAAVSEIESFIQSERSIQ